MQTHLSPITTQSGQVPSTLTDYPFAILETGLVRLATIANGGHTANASGFDIRPYTATDLATEMTYEYIADVWDPATGALEMYVKVPSMDDSFEFYLANGDAAHTTNGSSESTWNSNYEAVYHFGDGSTLSLLDSTSNSFDLTNNASSTAVAGPVNGGGVEFNGTTQYLSRASAAPITTTPAYLSCLLWTDTFAANKFAVCLPISSAAQINFGLSTRTSSLVRAINNGGQADSPTFSTGAWVHTAGRFISTTSRTAYLNGAAGTNNTTSTSGVVNNTIGIGANNSNGSAAQFFDGRIDEVRMMSVDPGADWVPTEDNNLLNPSTFYAVGTEQSVSGDVTINPTGFGTTASLGTPVHALSIPPSGFGLTADQGTMEVQADVTIYQIPGYELTTTLGTPTIIAGGNVTLTPSGFELVASLGTPVVAIDNIVITPSGFGLATSLGTPTLDIVGGLARPLMVTLPIYTMVPA